MIIIMSDLIATLRSLPAERVTAAAGQLLFAGDDPVRFVWVVERGCVHLRRYDERGGPAVMQRATAGMLLAESSLFSDVHHCEAVVVSDAELLRLERRHVVPALNAEPAQLWDLARHLAREVQRTRARVEVLSRKTVRERLDAWLALGDGAMPAHGRLASVAADIGVTPEAFYRELQRRRAVR